jgi:hypothetical protein
VAIESGAVFRGRAVASRIDMECVAAPPPIVCTTSLGRLANSENLRVEEKEHGSEKENRNLQRWLFYV